VALALAFGLGAQAPAQVDQLPRGGDVVDAPAIGPGLCLHNLFQTNMVLQRERPIQIWGWATPGASVAVALGDEERGVVAGADRGWSVEFPALAASAEPRAITVESEGQSIRCDNVVIGDIWLLGGQSNMEFPLERVENGELEIVAARYPDLRILTVPEQNGPEPKVGFPRLFEWSDWFGVHFRKGDWDVCSPEVVRELSAIGYVFARRVHMAAGIPIGVIDASRGGTTVETWTPDAVLRALHTPEVDAALAEWDAKVASYDPERDLADQREAYERRVARLRERGEAQPADLTAPTTPRSSPALDPNHPGNCFASMIAPIAGFPVKGAIFHQGFNNALQMRGEVLYSQVFPAMIRAWREAFGDPTMPFGIISLCTEGPPQTRDNYLEMMWNTGIYIRAAQYRTFLDLRDAGDSQIGFASSFDMRRPWYHPQQKLPVGERISRWALATQYGFGERIPWTPPRCTEVRAEGSSITLRLDHEVEPIDGGSIVGFAIAGVDRRFQPADAQWFVRGKDARGEPQFDRSALVLTSPLVPEPQHFRYAWGRNPMANLFATGHHDLPFATQRSDDWEMHAVPLESASRATLRREDVRRRLAECEAFLDEQR